MVAQPNRRPNDGDLSVTDDEWDELMRGLLRHIEENEPEIREEASDPARRFTARDGGAIISAATQPPSERATSSTPSSRRRARGGCRSARISTSTTQNRSPRGRSTSSSSPTALNGAT